MRDEIQIAEQREEGSMLAQTTDWYGWYKESRQQLEDI
jgi:hypothetical protein